MRSRLLCAAMLGAIAVFPAGAEDEARLRKDAKEAFSRAMELIDRDVQKAIQEADWGIQYLRQLASSQGAARFPETIAGLKRGEVETSDAMGVSVLTAHYRKGSEQVEVTLTRMDAAGGNPMSAFGAMAQMGMMAGPNRFRAAGFTGFQPEPGDVTIQTEVGMLNFQSDSRTGTALRDFAEAFAEAAQEFLSGK